MDDYREASKKYFTQKFGIPPEQFDDIITPAKKPSAAKIAELKRAMEAADTASKERMATALEKYIVSPAAEKPYELAREQYPQMVTNRLEEKVSKLPEYLTDADRRREELRILNNMRAEAAAKDTSFLAQKKLIDEATDGFQESVKELYSKNAPGAGKSGAVKAASMDKMNVQKSLAKKIPEYLKVAEEKLASDISKNIAKAIPATEAERMAGKAMLGKIASGAGKVASKLAGPIGVGLTAFDLMGAFGEAQDKGAAKIAADYAKENGAIGVKKITTSPTGEQTEGPEQMVGTTPITKEEFNAGYTPEERMRLKEMLKKLRAEARLRQ